MLWDDFLNSVHHDWRGDGAAEDRLDDSDWLDAWMDKQQLVVDHRPTAKDITSLKRLRALLHRMAKSFVDNSRPAVEDIVMLNEIMADGAVIRTLSADDDGYRIKLSPIGKQWTNLEAEIAASFSRMLTDNEPSRIRICDNPNCLWVYYDDTRNRSKRYCDDKMCGNLMKVRRFRARKKAESSSNNTN
ncbi:CGNR zinc finger domain-containing protein [Cohnella luojiensis]|uniref:Zinc finger CGNR domain-containing protein n=1 Tax=Cohnella luojiensis TaxID=652876 RepID=A0A4Y8LN51_9BACL|nr:CGNR zinc finger domain-containing protein [Cohnella luojiensis]TFE19654.1 hypothetical protein E2980_22480 [Cohnella luojiensis]